MDWWTDWTDGFGQTDRQTDWLDGQTDKLKKRTYRWKVGRTCARTDGQTDWAECTSRLDRLHGRTDGREGQDRLDWTDGQDGRTGRTDGGVDRLDGRTERKDRLTRWMDWIWTDQLDWCTEWRNNGQTRLMDVSEVYFYICEVGHLHDGVILLLRPESFSFSLSYLNLVMTLRFTVKLRKPWTPENFQECWLCTGQSQ